MENSIHEHARGVNQVGLQFAYFDRMPVGQLMSRATSDLQTVRFFLGYGLIFAFMHVFTLLIVSVILFSLTPGLAALALLMGPALAAIAWRYSRLSNPVCTYMRPEGMTNAASVGSSMTVTLTACPLGRRRAMISAT